MHSQTLEFETPHFLHGLFANNLALLKCLEERFHVGTTTRDAWLKIEGAEPDVAKASAVMRQLETARREGTEITERLFQFALDSASSPEKDLSPSLRDLGEAKLVLSSGRSPVTPKSRGQFHYLKAMDKHDVVFGTGPAGTGKTYLAMAKALDWLRQRVVDRLILTRPAVEAGEALGFLPGDLKEKIFPYLRPLYDALYEMLKPEEVERYIERAMIEIAPLAYMRGRTLNRACVILDEAQNTTCEQMFMFLTRLGEGSKCLVTGDISQVDLRPSVRSGLVEALENLKGVEGIHFQTFAKEDIVRHPVVQRIIDAYQRKRRQDR